MTRGAIPANVIGLPSARRPRVFAGGPAPAVWRMTGLYPASRPFARAAWGAARAASLAGLGRVALPEERVALLTECLHALGSEALEAFALFEDRNGGGRVSAAIRTAEGADYFLKGDSTQSGSVRLEREAAFLSSAHLGCAPRLRWTGSSDGTFVLVAGLIEGRRCPVTAEAPEWATQPLLEVPAGTSFAPDAHPWLVRLLNDEGLGKAAASWSAALQGRDWPSVLQHGDFAPWNVLRRGDGSCGIVDWESVDTAGFPGMDLAHWTLQVGALVRRVTPQKAAHSAVRSLLRYPIGGEAPSLLQARAIVALTALADHKAHHESGMERDDAVQRWRRSVWESDE